MKHYKVINIHTGVTHQGTAQEINQITGTARNILYKYARSGSVYHDTWKFEPLSNGQNSSDDKDFTNTINKKNCQDWDLGTKIFKEASERKTARPQKPKTHKLRTPYNTI